MLSKGSPISGQTVAWQAGKGIQPADTSATLTELTGIVSKALQVGPLDRGQQASAAACLNGTSQCVSFTAFAARPECAYVEPVSGTSQSLGVTATPAQVTLRVRDASGHPMAGGVVTFFQAVYAWSSPCPPHGRCAQTQLLLNQTSTAMSGLDGTVTFTPASIPGVATNVIGIAATGDTSTLTIAVEQHP